MGACIADKATPEASELTMGDAGTPPQEFYKTLLDHLYDGVYFVDRNRKITYWNVAATALSGYTAEEMLGHSCFDNLLMHTDQAGCNLCQGTCPLAAVIADAAPREADVFLRHKQGHRVPVKVRVTPICDSGGYVIGAAEIFSDNSVQLAAIERATQLQQIAYLDPLTGVGNRRYAEETLDSRMQECARYGNGLGVLFVDVDHFKQINDTYGHATGDEVLKMAARTIVNNLRPFDFVGRWGGDEFMVLLINVDAAGLRLSGQRILAQLRQSQWLHEDRRIGMTVSMGGVAIVPGETRAALLARADEMLYVSKCTGRNRISIG